MCKLSSERSRSSVWEGQILLSNTQGKQERQKRQRVRSQVKFGTKKRGAGKVKSKWGRVPKIAIKETSVPRVQFCGS